MFVVDFPPNVLKIFVDLIFGEYFVEVRVTPGWCESFKGGESVCLSCKVHTPALHSLVTTLNVKRANVNTRNSQMNEEEKGFQTPQHSVYNMGG